MSNAKEFLGITRGVNWDKLLYAEQEKYIRNNLIKKEVVVVQ